MAIGNPRWGGIRKTPYNPDSPDADNDGIVQEGTLFERPAGTRIVSTLTGLELDLGTPGNSLQDVSNTQIVDREGRPVPYRQSWSSGTLSAGERNGTIGNSNGTVGSALGNLDGPPPAPKPDPVRLRSTDVDKNGKPLRVFVSDDRRFHGVMPQDWAGFDNPAWREAAAHWGGSLRDGEMPISANDPRLPDTLFYVTRNPSAQRDLGVVRTDGERVDLFVSREDADEALSAERLYYPGAGIVEVPTESIRTGAAVTLSDGTGGEFSSVYHGSPWLNPDGRPSVRNAQETRGTVWFARDRDLAEEYTYPREFGESVTEFFDEDTGEYVDFEPGPVLNFGLDISNPFYHDAEGRSVDAVEQARLVREAQENGHDALVLNNVVDSVDSSGDPGQVIAVFDDSKIVPVRRTQVSVFGDVRLSADSAPEPVRREADIPTPESLDPIKDRFDAEGFELYLVGGAVRDTLMGRDIKDYDLASNATPDEIEAMLADVDGARLDLTGKDFAVVRVNMPDGEEYEIATFRRDVGEGRRPDEVEFTTIDEDVRRRDLTMNALFYDLSTNEIVDYVGGIDDIENGVVRAVGDPGERFREDPLRILRAFRFSGRTGWGMDAATVDAIRSNSKLRGVSGERVHDEFVRGIDSAVSPAGYIQQIDLVDNGTGAVWGQVFPGLNVSPERLPADGSYGNRAALVASLLADNDIDSVKAVLKDRKFTNDEITDVELIMQARNINDGNVAALKNKFGKNRRVSADDMRAFHGVQPETEDEIEPFLQFADAPPALTANDLQARGIEPGPQFGAMLREAEEQRYREIRDGFSAAVPEASSDLPKKTRNWKRPPVPSRSGFDTMLSPDTMSGHKGHVYSTSDTEVDEVLDRIYDTAVERGWGMKIANEYFWDITNDPEVTSANKGQRGKGVTIYFPNRDTWEDDARELHRLMEGYEPFGDGDIPEDTMIGNGVGLRYEFQKDPGANVDMTDADGRNRYSDLYRPAALPHTPESRAVHDRYRELFPSETRSSDTDLAEFLAEGNAEVLAGDKPAPARPAPVNKNRDQRSFKDADDRIDVAAVDAPEIASDPSKVQSSLAPRPGEESPGFAFRPVDQLQNLKAQAEDELTQFLADPKTTPERLEQYRDWVEATQAHIATLDKAISNEGGWTEIAIEQFDDGAPDSITAVMESDSFKNRINDILLEIDPQFRPSSVAISPVDADGNTIADHMGFYYRKEDTVYIHPSMLATVFRDEGVSFDDYAKWANSQNVWVNPANPTGETRGPKPGLDELREFALEVDLASTGLLPDGFDLSDSGRLSGKERAEQRDLLEDAVRQYLKERPYRDIWDSPNKGRDAQEAALLRETLLHESFHGVHFRVDGDMDSPEYIEVRDKVIKAIQNSGLFEELIEDNPEEYGRPDNYFQYTMMWLGLGGGPATQDQQSFLDNMAPEYRELLDYYQGGELFAEALTHAMLGRKFPGSDIILEHITRER